MSDGLLLEDVSVQYGTVSILDRLRLEIPPGQRVSLLGASGSGKSTLLRLLAGLLKPSHGRLSWRSQPIRGTSLERGLVFQDYSLFPWLTMVNNVALAVGKARPQAGKAERCKTAVHWLRRVGLDEAIAQYPFELSGGMQQRGAIARLLALGSPLLLMDEPFGALDPVNRARLQDLLVDIVETAQPRKTLVFVTHDVDEALYLSDRIIMLGSAPGRIIADLSVPPPRRRDRRTLFESATFHHLREQITARLQADTLQRLVA
jgi:NitT/TauT family transport system ATP-binding protein